MKILLLEIDDIGNYADDYTRCGVTTAEDLSKLSVEDVVFLGISGIGEKRAAQHIAAAKHSILNPPTRKKTMTETHTKTLKDHAIANFLNDKQLDRVQRFANACKAVVDADAWATHIVKRAELSGDPQRELVKFARNLELRVV